MTPSKQAKAAGLRNLKQVSEMTGRSVGTLHNYHKRFPRLFEIILLGCNQMLDREKDNDY